MALALIASSFASVVALAFVTWNGFRVPEHISVTQHITYAVPTMVVSMFAHSMAMFYFIGTGVQIKDAVKNHVLSPEFVNETKALKKEVFPIAMLTMGVVMAAFIVGGGVHTHAVPRWVHTGLAFAAVLVSARAFWIESRAIYRNLLLAERVAKAVEDSGARR